jgi:RHH-type rel operon transcriptional repressor/antitoxin RelB
MATQSTTISVCLDSKVKKRLEALAKTSKRSKSFLAAETIAAYVDAEEWQVTEIHQDLKHLDDGRLVPHDRVVT